MAGVTMPTRATIIEQWQKNAFIGREKRKTTATVKPDVSYPRVSAVT